MREVTNIPLFSIVRLLPFALPKSICSCKAENVSVSGGQKIILVNMNGNISLNTYINEHEFSYHIYIYDLVLIAVCFNRSL